MKNPIRWLLSLIFVIQMYLMMAILAVFFTPIALFHKPTAWYACQTYCHWVRWTARWMIGLRSEVRGEVPTDEVLIAAKHQSFFDIIILASVLPRFKFIMKKSLTKAPILGWYAKRIGCIPVDRGRRAEAIKKMVSDVADGSAEPGQLIIYAQGTRVAPGVKQPYKIGAGVLYEASGQDCVPAATNVGVFWPRIGIYRKPGLAVVEFLPRIKNGMEIKDFMAHLETTVEEASDRLMAEAGFDVGADIKG